MNKSNLHYSDYLQLDRILNSQDLESQKNGQAAHEEMLFIIIHQAYELWFKQILHEVSSIKPLFDGHLDDKNLGLINSRLERTVQILQLLVQQISIIETMTPQQFLDFRDFLVPASGFQSLQFRLLETHLGLSWDERGEGEKIFFNSRLKPSEVETLNKAQEEKSIRTLVDQWLYRLSLTDIGAKEFWEQFPKHIYKIFNADQKAIESNPTLSQEQKHFELQNLSTTKNSFNALFDQKEYDTLLASKHVFFKRESTLSALFITLYQEYPLMHLPFKLLQNLMDIDKYLTQWRYAHALMVKRMLGTKIGTGGSSGHEYLRKTAERHTLFKDLIHINSFLIPRSKRPTLSQKLEQNLSYFFISQFEKPE